MKALFRAEVEDIEDLTLNAYDLLTNIDGKMYAIGCWSPENRIEVTDKRGFIYKYNVNLETKAIHFEDMLDSENNPIFASLQEDGKGGSILEHPMDLEQDKFPCIMKKGNCKRYFPFGKKDVVVQSNEEWKVIGVQK